MNVLTLVDIDQGLGGMDWAVDGRALGKWAARPGCGAVCVRITIDDETVTWSDSCQENGYEEADEPDPDFVDVPVIRFRATDYVTTVRQALSR
jgi:hypothetical protein